MTDATPLASEQITQEDREAAASCYEQGHPFDPCCPPQIVARKMREGMLDTTGYVQAFARHRIASLSATPAPSDQDASRLREALNKIADLGSCAHGKTPAYKLFQQAIDIATGAL